jgi:hypothetical protein
MGKAVMILWPVYLLAAAIMMMLYGPSVVAQRRTPSSWMITTIKAPVGEYRINVVDTGMVCIYTAHNPQNSSGGMHISTLVKGGGHGMTSACQ